jgi:hypothetical protein
MNTFLAGTLALGLVLLAIGGGLELLNARDRRRDRVAALVLRACATPSLRGLISLRVQAPLLGQRLVVVLDLSACGPDLVWPTVRRVAAILPRDAALAIDARLDPELPVGVTLAARGGSRPATNVVM